MNFFRQIFNSVFCNKAAVSLELSRLNLREVDLKKILTEHGSALQSKLQDRCESLDWETSPAPVLKSNLSIKANFSLSRLESLVFYFFPGPIQNQKREHLRKILLSFLNLNPLILEPKFKGKNVWEHFFLSPRSICVSGVSYKKMRMETNGDIELADPSFELLRFDGKVEIIVRLYRLHQIQYLFSKKIFTKPEPYLGELFLKGKDKHKEGSFGQSGYEFQGRFLPNQRDQYLLEYWGLVPIWNPSLLKLIPSEIFEDLKFQNDERQFKEILNGKNQIAELRLFVDQASTFLPDHPI